MSPVVSQDKQRTLARRVINQLLARRDYSVAEIRQKLANREIASDIIETVIAQYLERGWLDDARCAESFVRYYHERCYGPIAIRQKLKLKHIGDSEIENALQQSDLDWFAAAQRLYTKKFNIAEDAKERAKQQRYLLSRGYDLELVRAILFK